MTVYIVLILISLFFSAFYAAAETAYNFANPNHLEDLAEKGSKFYKLALFVIRHYNFAISSSLVGVNIAHFGMSACVTLAVYEVLSHFLSGDAGGISAAAATLAATVIILIFGEIIPKTFASQRGDSLSAKFAVPMIISMIIFFPVVVVINAIIWVVKLPFGKGSEQTVTEEELAVAIEQSEEEGGLEEDKSELLQSAINFKDTDIRRLVVPRVDVVAFDMNDSEQKLIELIKETSHSRIPVYTDTIDNITGILYSNLFLLELASHEQVDYRKCVKEPCIIYPSASLPDALEEMRRSKMQMAVVPDEYGGTLGIVTMEDILEELVGDIDDETDDDEEDIVPVRKDFYEVNGDVSVYDAIEEFEGNPDEIDSDYTTVGGWVIEQLEGFPEVGKSFEYNNMTVTVTEMDGTRVTKVSFAIHEKPEEE